MEKFSDKLRAFALAMALHVACILALLVGLWWTHESRPVSMPGPVIEATLIGPTAAPKARAGAQKPTPAKPEPPKPEPPKPEPPKPQSQPEPPKPETQTPNELQRQNQVDQERVAALAQEKAEQEKREQEEKVRQKQVELDEKQRKLREEQQKQLADIRKQREDAEKKVKQASDALAQMEDRNQKAAAQAQPEAEHEAEQATTGAGGQDNDLTARYAAAIQAAVTNNWNRPDNASAGLRCVLNIAQIPGGDVISVTIGSPCNADPVTRTSIEQAVMKAAPLPYQSYEKVFQRNIKFTFRFDG
ncbi:cell envelope integrity protein TolA [Dokdonella sp.]|uniref:cell envelope integrity protein TolA n=1 Tax=Dokdonella sp. TaxID=2291710 RepID=UPI003783700D